MALYEVKVKVIREYSVYIKADNPDKAGEVLDNLSVDDIDMWGDEDFETGKIEWVNETKIDIAPHQRVFE